LGWVQVNRIGWFGLQVARFYIKQRGVLVLCYEEKNPRGPAMASMIFLVTIET